MKITSIVKARRNHPVAGGRTSADRVKQFVRDLNFGFRLGWADRETALTLMNGSNAVPQTLVIRPDGRILNHWDGYTRGHSGDHLRASIERALSEASEAREQKSEVRGQKSENRGQRSEVRDQRSEVRRRRSDHLPATASGTDCIARTESRVVDVWTILVASATVEMVNRR